MSETSDLARPAQPTFWELLFTGSSWVSPASVAPLGKFP